MRLPARAILFPTSELFDSYEVIKVEDHAPEPLKPFRDGRVHVMARQCDTCIFRPGNLMHLDPSRRDDMVQGAIANNTAIICHSTLSDVQAVCRGFFDQHKTSTLRLAEAMGVIEYDSAEGRHP